MQYLKLGINQLFDNQDKCKIAYQVIAFLPHLWSHFLLRLFSLLKLIFEALPMDVLWIVILRLHFHLNSFWQDVEILAVDYLIRLCSGFELFALGFVPQLIHFLHHFFGTIFYHLELLIHFYLNF